KVVAGEQHVELDRVASLAAAEAVEQPRAGIDPERRALLFMQRTKTLVPLPGLLQSGVVRGDAQDVRRVADRLDQLRGQMYVAEGHGQGLGLDFGSCGYQGTAVRDVRGRSSS